MRLPIRSRWFTVAVITALITSLSLTAQASPAQWQTLAVGVYNALAAPLGAPTLSAIKVATLFTDVDGDTQADPGDTLRYTITMTNTGSEALSVSYVDTLDANTTLVGGSVNVAPIAVNDVYTTVGNTLLEVGVTASGHPAVKVAGSAFMNDLEFIGDTFSLASFAATSANGGVVTLTTNGTFTYTPPVGFVGTDTFTYTVQDTAGATDSATVTVNVVNRVWYVRNNASAGDGRSNTPLNSLLAAQTASNVNDFIYVFQGDGTTTNQNAGIALKNGQTLIGQGSALIVSGFDLLAAGTAPVIGNASGSGVTLAQNNTLQGLGVGNTTNFAISGTNFSTLNVLTVTINTTNGALNLNTGTVNGAFGSTISSGGSNNLNLTNVAGTLNLGTGALSGASGTAFNVSAGTASFSYAGSVTKNTSGALVSIASKTSGTVTLSGALNCNGCNGLSMANNSGGTYNFTGAVNLSTGTNNAVNLTSNSGASINFAPSSGGLILNTTLGVGFNATGGGTVTVAGSNNTITATTGTALNVANTTIGATGLTFQSISSNGGSNTGIILNTTGTSGGLTVTGAGTSNSGGTIANKTGANGSTTTGIGIYLNSTTAPAFNYMRLNNFENYAIRGLNVNGFTLANSTINHTSGQNGNNDALDEGSILFGTESEVNGLTGIALINNVTVEDGFENNFKIANLSGSLQFTMTNSTVRDTTAASPGNNGLEFRADGTANIRAFIDNSTFSNNRANGVQASNTTSHSGALNVWVEDSTLTSNNIGVSIANGGSGTMNFNVRNNTFNSTLAAGASPININLAAGGGGPLDGIIQGNIISNNNSQTGPGIRVTSNGTDGDNSNVLSVLINNNTISQIANRGIEVIARDGNSRINATITNNSVQLTDPLSADGIRVDAGTISTDTTSVCADIRGNNSDTVAGLYGIRLRQRFLNTTFRLPGYAAGAQDMTAVQNFLQTNNPASAGFLADYGGAGFAGGAACTQPAPFGHAVDSNQRGLSAAPADALTQVQARTIAPTRQAAEPARARAATRSAKALYAPLASGETINLLLGTLPAGERFIITYRATVDSPFLSTGTQVCNQGTFSGGNFTNLLTDDPAVAGTANPTCVPVDAKADLSLTKTDGNTTVVPGQTVTYTLTYGNAATATRPALNTIITETVPANSSYAGTGWTLVSGSTYTRNVGTVAVGDSGSVTFAVTVNNPVAAGVTQLTNTASIGYAGPEANPTDNTATDTNTVIATPDLTVSKTDGGVSTTPGAVLTYTLTYINNGNQDATGVTLNETVPANTSFTGTSWTCFPNNNAGSTCTRTIGGLAGGGANGTATFVLTVVNPVAAGVTQIANTVSVADDGSNGVDPTPGNNSASDTTPVVAAPNYAVTKSAPGTINPGDVLLYTVNVANNGNQGGTGLILTETVPTGATFNVGSSTSGWTLVSGSTYTFAVGALNGGSSDVVTFAVTANSPAVSGQASLVNVVQAGDDGANEDDPNPANNIFTLTTTLNAAPVLALSKTDGGQTATPGNPVTYTLNYSNTGNQNATGAVLTETTPANTNFNAGASTPGWTLVSGSTYTYAIGALNAGDNGAATFVVTVNPTLTAGVTTLTNTASLGLDDANGVIPPANATDTTPVEAAPELRLTKSDAGQVAQAGAPLTYTLFYTNAGNQNATGVFLTDTLPLSVTFNAGASTAGWTLVSGSTYTFAVGNLTAGASGSATLVVTVSIPAPTEVVNSAGIGDDTTNGPDPLPGNNVSLITTTVNPPPVVNDDFFGPTDENTSLFVDGPGVLANDFDPLGEPVSVVDFDLVSALGAATGGTGNGSLFYNPSAAPALQALAQGESVTDSLTYRATDGTSIRQATVFITVTGVNDTPSLLNLAAAPSVTEGGVVTLTGVISDVDASDTFTLTVDWGEDAPQTILLSDTGAFTFTRIYADDNPTGTASDAYTITVSVADPFGGTNSATTSTTVNNVAPTLSDLNVTASNEAGTATLTGLITDPGTQDTFTVTVGWGDGLTDTFTLPAGSTAFTRTHSYADDNPTGTASDAYTVTVTVADDDTGADTEATTATVNNVAPTVSDLTLSSNIISEGQAVTLTGVLSDVGALDTLRVVIDWSDGTTSTLNLPAGAEAFTATHSYADDDPSGTVSDVVAVVVTVTDDDTGTATDNTSLTVNNIAPTITSWTLSATTLDEGQTLTGTLTFDDPGASDTFTVTVDWGDGASVSVPLAAGTRAITLTHLYSDDVPTATPTDIYSIKLLLTDDDNGGAAQSETVTVNNVAPSVEAGPNVTAIVGNPVSFTGTFTDPGAGDTHAITWSFGDGFTATGTLAPSHTYNTVGVYTVTLNVADDDGGTGSDTLRVTVITGKIYLPLITRNFVSAPDLVVSALNVTTSTVQVVVRNQGTSPVLNPFYVDVYVNPAIIPTAVNQTWDIAASQIGLVWCVDSLGALTPGGVLTLTIGDAFYLASEGNFTGTLPAGAVVYAQVDSTNALTTYDAVLERHELTGEPYNNITGPASVPDSGLLWPTSPADLPQRDRSSLPPRR